MANDDIKVILKPCFHVGSSSRFNTRVQIILGIYDTPAEAHEAFGRKLRQVFGEIENVPQTNPLKEHLYVDVIR